MRVFVTCLAVLCLMSSFGLAADITISLPGEVRMDLVHVPAGTFWMGSPTDERGRHSNEVRHQVTLTNGYYMSKTEVTQAQWQAVMGNNPSDPNDPSSCTSGNYGVGPEYPVYCVSWTDIAHPSWNQTFLRKLNAHLTSTGQPGAGLFRLPTEAEWERAARGGTQMEFSFAVPPDWDTLCGSFPEAESNMLWCGSDTKQTIPVGSKLANPYGLHDMHGNVYEWVHDQYESNLGTDPVTDPIIWNSHWHPVVRGGGWYGFSRSCRSAYRYSYAQYGRYYGLGFRIVRTDTP